jgi:hypothetical protein
MKTAFFHVPAEREAYDHGRTQGQLEIARKALAEILDAAENQRARSIRWTIATKARLALQLSAPDPETIYQSEKRPL